MVVVAVWVVVPLVPAGASTLAALVGSTLLTTGNASLRWVADVKTKASKINVAMTPEKKSTEARLGKNVEDTVEDGLGVGWDDIGTLG